MKYFKLAFSLSVDKRNETAALEFFHDVGGAELVSVLKESKYSAIHIKQDPNDRVSFEKTKLGDQHRIIDSVAFVIIFPFLVVKDVAGEHAERP